MKIQLVQSEIEQAISNYIRETITVNEGMSITMELRATRGAEGFQADIDISRTADVPVAVAKPVQAAPVARTATKTTTVGQSPAAATPAPAKQPAAAPQPEPEASPAASAGAEDAGAVADPEEQVENTQEAVTTTDPEPTTETGPTGEATADPAPRRSLFAGLKKPNNAA